jgi:large subunit ribosomal protein L28
LGLVADLSANLIEAYKQTIFDVFWLVLPRGGKMAAYCQVTETKPQFGHAVSHAQNKTKRRFNPNIQKKTYFVPSLKRNVTLQLSARGIKVIDARGIESVIAEIMARGEKI